MTSPDWEVVWQDRIVEKINVNDLIEEGDVKSYLEKTLEAGKSKQKATLLKHIDKADGFKEADEAVDVISDGIVRVEKKVKERLSKDIIDGRKDIIKEGARDKVPDIRSADTLDDITDIVKSVPTFARTKLRKEAKFRIRFLIRKGTLPEGTKLPTIRKSP